MWMSFHVMPPRCRPAGGEVGWARDQVRRLGARGGVASLQQPGARVGGWLGQQPGAHADGQVQLGRPWYLPLASIGAQNQLLRVPCASRLRLPARTAHKPPARAAGLSGGAIPSRGPKGTEKPRAWGDRPGDRVGGYVPPVLPGCSSPAPKRKPE